jgi:hypothetical protein
MGMAPATAGSSIAVTGEAAEGVDRVMKMNIRLPYKMVSTSFPVNGLGVEACN